MQLPHDKRFTLLHASPFSPDRTDEFARHGAKRSFLRVKEELDPNIGNVSHYIKKVGVSPFAGVSTMWGTLQPRAKLTTNQILRMQDDPWIAREILREAEFELELRFEL